MSVFWPAIRAGIAGILFLAPGSVLACATCYGQSDSPMAAGMNWGIFSLLAMILFVLGGVAAFFVFLARRSAAMAAGGVLAFPAASGVHAEGEDHTAGKPPFRHKSATARFAPVFAWRRGHPDPARAGSRLSPHSGSVRAGTMAD